MKITLHNRTPPVSIDCEGYIGIKINNCEQGECSVLLIAEYKTGRQMRYETKDLLLEKIDCFKFAEEISSIVFELSSQTNSDQIVRFDVELMPENKQEPGGCLGII